jgi:hypothetical protein
MFKRLFSSVIGIFFFTALFAQEKYVISGTVVDSSNGETLIGATVFIKSINAASASNAYGFFSITVAKGSYTVETHYVGYESEYKTVAVNSNVKLNFSLHKKPLNIKEVVVTADRKNAPVTNMEMGTTKMEMKTISAIPPLMGEVDVIRSIQLLPGITAVSEGSSGFNVRGGAIDQNLVLLDEAPVYNTSHLFGFFSVFNPDAVKDVKLSKAAIGANYGGRLSSVLDVRMKEGNMKKLGVAGGLGAIFSRLMIEAPIVKDKASFIIAGRRSYIDQLAAPFLTGTLKDTRLYFYDLTMKANWIVNKNNRLYLSSYLGRDLFGFPGATFSWGNATTSLRWNHVF